MYILFWFLHCTFLPRINEVLLLLLLLFLLLLLLLLLLILTAEIFLLGDLQLVAKGQVDAFTLHV